MKILCLMTKTLYEPLTEEFWETILAMASLGHSMTLVFLNEGLTQLQPNDLAKSQRNDFTKVFGALDIYEINNIFSLGTIENKRQDIVVTSIDEMKLVALKQQHNVIWTF